MRPGGMMVPVAEAGRTRLYSVDRDLAYCGPSLVEAAVARAAGRRWRELDALGARLGVGPADLAHALGCAARFCFEAADRRESTAETAHRSGWLGVPVEHQVVVLAHLGSVLLGAVHTAVREATLGGDGPAAGLPALLADSRRAARALTGGRQ